MNAEGGSFSKKISLGREKKFPSLADRNFGESTEAYPDLEYDAMVLFGLRELKGFALGMAAARELAKL